MQPLRLWLRHCPEIPVVILRCFDIGTDRLVINGGVPISTCLGRYSRSVDGDELLAPYVVFSTRVKLLSALLAGTVLVLSTRA